MRKGKVTGGLGLVVGQIPLSVSRKGRWGGVRAETKGTCLLYNEEQTDYRVKEATRFIGLGLPNITL